MTGRSEADFAALERKLAESTNAHAERAAQQAATTDVLRAMSASPDDPQPVFELIARRARALCRARAVAVSEYDGTIMHMRVFKDYDEAAAAAVLRAYPRVPGPETMHGRTVLAREIVHVRDIDADKTIFETGRGLGHKSLLGVPLSRDGKVLGMSGLDLLPAVKQRRPGLPVFMISAYGDASTVATAMQRGANEFLTKPVDFAKLKQDIAVVIAAPGGGA